MQLAVCSVQWSSIRREEPQSGILAVPPEIQSLAGMLTSVKEGLPYTILEAGMAGLPVLASSIGGIPEIIENNVNGMLVQKADTYGITACLNHLVGNPEERKIFGQRLQQKIEKEFSLPDMLEKTFEIYND